MRSSILRLALSAIVVALGASCVDNKAGQLVPASDGNTPAELIAFDAVPAAAAPALPEAPLNGTHIDGEGSSYRPAGTQFRGLPQARNRGKEIELVLRSTPPGAIASIDGKPIGPTPTYWHGPADGKAHEYTFTKEGYAIARYRFVSTQSGVVHGSLKALVVGGDKAPAPGH